MYFRFVHRTGNHLHRFGTGSIPPYIFQVTTAAHHHPVPAKQHFFRKWFSEGLVEVNHHLGDSSLRGPNPSLVRSQSQLFAEGGLNARPVQDFTFDFGGRQGLRAHGVDRQLVPVFAPKVPHRANEHASANQELLFRSF